jgi:ERAP1-like C-terminal domain
VFSTALKHSKNPKADFDAVKKIYQKSDSVDARLTALSSLGAVNSIELVNELLRMAIDQQMVKSQDIYRPLESIASLNPKKAEVLNIIWQWCATNWSTIYDQLSGTISMSGTLVQTCVKHNIGYEFVKTVEDWAKGADCATPELAAQRVEQLLVAKRPLEQALERIRGVTAWTERENKAVKAWAKMVAQ